MTLDEIKAAITGLPDDAIRPLLEWLGAYYDGPVWDRQISADVERLGVEGFRRRLAGLRNAGEEE